MHGIRKLTNEQLEELEQTAWDRKARQTQLAIFREQRRRRHVRNQEMVELVDKMISGKDLF